MMQNSSREHRSCCMYYMCTFRSRSAYVLDFQILSRCAEHSKHVLAFSHDIKPICEHGQAGLYRFQHTIRSSPSLASVEMSFSLFNSDQEASDLAIQLVRFEDARRSCPRSSVLDSLLIARRTQNESHCGLFLISDLLTSFDVLGSRLQRH